MCDRNDQHVRILLAVYQEERVSPKDIPLGGVKVAGPRLGALDDLIERSVDLGEERVSSDLALGGLPEVGGLGFLERLGVNV